MTRTTSTAVALLLALCVLVAACGGSGTIDAVGTSSAPVAVEPATLPGTGVVVKPGRANWTTGHFQAAVYAQLLEELGYVVNDPARQEYPPTEAYRAMAQGEFDFWANGWFPQHLIWHQAELPDGTLVGDHVVVIGDELLDGGLQGMVVTRTVAEEHSVRSLAQINDDPTLVELFDIDGDGLADIFGCPEDWTCDDVIDEMISFNSWTNLEQTKAAYEGMAATAVDRVNNGLPTILYTWSPSGHLSLLRPGDNVLWLSVGGESNVLDGSTESGLDYASAGPGALGMTCTDDPCWPGWEVEDIKVVANAEFAAANPAAVALFDVARLSVDDISSQNAAYDAGENTDADVERHAMEWIASHREDVDQWIAHALAAR